MTNLPNYIVDEDEYRELLKEEYRLKSTIKTLKSTIKTLQELLKTIVELDEWDPQDRNDCIREALDGEA